MGMKIITLYKKGLELNPYGSVHNYSTSNLNKKTSSVGRNLVPKHDAAATKFHCKHGVLLGNFFVEPRPKVQVWQDQNTIVLSKVFKCSSHR